MLDKKDQLAWEEEDYDLVLKNFKKNKGQEINLLLVC